MDPFDKPKPAGTGHKRPQHHYALAHIALRKFCQANPLAFFGVVGSPHRSEFLEEVWQAVRQNCDDGGAPDFDIKDVEVTTCRVKNYPTIVFRMPAPAQPTEAHLVAVVLKVAADAAVPPEKPAFDYFTLEKGVSMDGTDRTVLCGWSEEDTHSNFGAGPPPTEADFLRAVEKML